jgi:hypothetical protein
MQWLPVPRDLALSESYQLLYPLPDAAVCQPLEQRGLVPQSLHSRISCAYFEHHILIITQFVHIKSRERDIGVEAVGRKDVRDARSSLTYDTQRGK